MKMICACCGTENAPNAATCVACGEASWVPSAPKPQLSLEPVKAAPASDPKLPPHPPEIVDEAVGEQDKRSRKRRRRGGDK